MPSEIIRELLEKLPSKMRNNVEGYVDAVAAALPEIEKDANVRLLEKRDTFLYLVAIRKIWSAVSSQFWIMNDCIEIAGRSEYVSSDADMRLKGFRLGRDVISRGSQAFSESEILKIELELLLNDLKIMPLVSSSISLAELAQLTVKESDRPAENT